MKHPRKVLTAFVLSSVLISFNCVNTYATVFNDVNKDHWAYDYIQNMADLGLLVGDLSGNFNPDSYISKFDTLKIIATLCGYNFNTKDQTEKEYYKILNDKYKDDIATYEKKYSKWNSSISYEMAYLLEKGILKLNELDQFIVLNDGKEQLRALSREEIALYLVRIMEIEEEVNKMVFTPILKDHLDIAPDKINSVYYLQSLNILTKEGENFYPKKAVTKAELSQIITNFLNYTKINIKIDNYKSDFLGNNIQTKFVTIEKIYSLDNIIQTKAGYVTKTYKLADNLSIKINGEKALLNAIPEGSYAEITFNNYLITGISVNTNVINTDNSEETKDYKIINGVIKNITKDSIAISYSPINSDGFIEKEEIEIIPLNKDYKVIKGFDSISTKNLNIGDLATIKLYNNMATEIYIEDENSIYIGEFIKKSEDNSHIIIKTFDNKILNLELNKDYKITKNGKDELNIKNLCIGDKLTLITDKNKVFSIVAKGEKTEKQGIIKSIKICEDYAIINLQDEKNINDLSTYYVNTDKIDIYSIRILDKVYLKMDSKEIYSLNLIERFTKNS